MPPKSDIIHIDDIPRGYTKGVAPNGSSFIVPQFLVPDLYQGFAGHRQKADLDLTNATAHYAQHHNLETEELAGGLITYPADPVLSDRERLSAHAEIIALSRRLGISYKDASHRLYMAEVERVKAINLQSKAWANLAEGIRMSVQKLINAAAPNPESSEDGKGEDERGNPEQ